MHVFYTPDILNNPELPEEEAGHCLRVLRLSIGDEIMLTDGKGCFYKAVISAALVAMLTVVLLLAGSFAYETQSGRSITPQALM